MMPNNGESTLAPGTKVRKTIMLRLPSNSFLEEDKEELLTS